MKIDQAFEDKSKAQAGQRSPQPTRNVQKIEVLKQDQYPPHESNRYQSTQRVDQDSEEANDDRLVSGRLPSTPAGILLNKSEHHGEADKSIVDIITNTQKPAQGTKSALQLKPLDLKTPQSEIYVDDGRDQVAGTAGTAHEVKAHE